MTNHLAFVDWHEVPVLYVPKWWDKPRWWLVRLLGGQCPFDAVKVTHVPVDGKTFMESLWKQRRVLVESFRREPMELWMGPEEYRTLMDAPEVRQAFHVRAQFNYGRHEVYGLTVHVIPWMRGMLVMPAIFGSKA